MALSEHEQRLLDEMERNLLQNDADVVVPGGSRPLSYGSLVLGILIALAGLGGVILGIAIRQPLVGIAGFAVMFVGVLLAMRRSGPAPSAGPAERGHGAAGGRPRSSFMSTLEDRWDRRRDER